MSSDLSSAIEDPHLVFIKCRICLLHQCGKSDRRRLLSLAPGAARDTC